MNNCSSSADPLPLPDDWIKTPFARQARERLAGLIQSEFRDSSLFVVKDPRISRLLPLRAGGSGSRPTR